MGTITKLFTKGFKPPHITLFEERESVTYVWEKYQRRTFPYVHIYHGDVWDYASSLDALVVPLNSSGQIPEVYLRYFNNPALEQRLRSAIRNKHEGKLMMGRAVLIATDNQEFPYIICTPISRPDIVRGNEPTNAYVATRAILDLWRFGRFQRRSVRNFVGSIGMSMLVPDSAVYSKDTVAKEQMKAIEESLSIWVSALSRSPHLRIVPDLSKS